jgi:hypothetical protein
MKKYFIPFVVILITTAISCNKDANTPQVQQPTLSDDDARTVLLKDVVAQSLPSPYFHFIYDSLHYVKQINFASGFNIYNVEYENKRVKKMTNLKNNNSLLYSYNDNRVSEITEFSGRTGNKIFTYRLSYNISNQLTQVLWFEFSNNSNGNLYKKSVLAYQRDGNLAAIDHYRTSAGQLSLVKRDQFSNYDTKTNVDDFYLLEDFFDTYLFLPQVKLQKINPRNQQITSIQNDYEISYTYEYQNTLPVRKTGNIFQTRGTGSGRSLQITNLYNYY